MLSSPTTHHFIITMSSSTNNGGSDQTLLTPNTHRGATKPVRKRSRASKKTPTTLLNASTTNFRDLVQQFTGFQAVSSSVSVQTQMQNQRGPVYLSFGDTKQGLLQTTNGAENNYHNYENHHQYVHSQISTPQQQYDQMYTANGNTILQSSANNNVEVEENGSLFPDYHDYYSLNQLTLDSFLR